eukprot:CAMPEP_0197743714 /NCGR_PEP_ID=MMETSP1435-20131217/36096_1 /TAXON_ID=426625 /ORGANISM="Chaetoceros brevis, Strain CCMP164" /LENGTH=40 /DNA_ID= /DNA_START= /DNA_END= /DNA_ORIENTATION=
MKTHLCSVGLKEENGQAAAEEKIEVDDNASKEEREVYNDQ